MIDSVGERRIAPQLTALQVRLLAALRVVACDYRWQGSAIARHSSSFYECHRFQQATMMLSAEQARTTRRASTSTPVLAEPLATSNYPQSSTNIPDH